MARLTHSEAMKLHREEERGTYRAIREVRAKTYDQTNIPKLRFHAKLRWSNYKRKNSST